MAWTKEARAAAAAKRRARGPRSGAKGYRDKVVSAKALMSDRGKTATDLRGAYQGLTGNKKVGYGTSKQALSLAVDRSLRKVAPAAATKPRTQGDMKQKVFYRKQAGRQGAADRIWSAMKSQK